MYSRKNRIKKYGTISVSCICVVVQLFFVIRLFSSIRLSGDDFFYYSFVKHGIHHYISKIIEHYVSSNGRLFVHSVEAFFLDNSLAVFRFVNVVMLMISAWFCLRLVDCNKNRGIIFLPLSLGMFMLIGNQIVRETMLWVSGSFNYLFPLCLSLVYMYCLSDDTSKIRRIVVVIIGFLVSMTTELMSFVTIVMTMLVLAKRYRSIRDLPSVYKVAICIQLVGFIVLVVSPGMHRRLGADDVFEMLWHAVVNLNIFMQKIWEKDGAAWVITLTMLFCAIRVYRNKGSKWLIYAMAITASLPIFTVSGVIYSLWTYVLFGIAFLCVLIWYGVVALKEKDYITIFLIVAFVLSFGTICASGIVGYRMLFLSIICLVMIGIRALRVANLNDYVLSGICVALSIISSINFINIKNVNVKNSKIWDKNQNVIMSYNGENVIVLDNIEEEMFFQGSVPLRDNFGNHYLREFNIPEDVRVLARDKESYTVKDDKNTCITVSALKRNGVCYVWIRDLSDYLGTGCEWVYDCAQIQYEGELYRFSGGAYSVMTEYVGGMSKKLINPVRIINGCLYISLDDAERLFGLNLISRKNI